MSEKVAKDASTREALLAAAAKVFSAKGYEGATVKDLADAAGANVSLVSYYFGGKEGLYRECLGDFGKDRLATAERVLKSPESEQDFRVRLTMFAEEFVRANLRDADLCKIIHRDIDLGGSPIAMDVFKTTFLPLFHTFQRFFEDARENGLLRAELDPQNVAAMLFGALVHAIKIDALRIEVMGQSLADEQVLAGVLKDYISIHLDGCLSRKREK